MGQKKSWKSGSVLPENKEVWCRLHQTATSFFALLFHHQYHGQKAAPLW